MALKELPVRTRGVCCDFDVAVEPEATAGVVDVLKALADPTRLSMVASLRRHEGPVCVCDLVATYDLSQPTISHHMAVLRRAGLVDAQKQGLWTFYALRVDLPEPVRKTLEALA